MAKIINYLYNSLIYCTEGFKDPQNVSCRQVHIKTIIIFLNIKLFEQVQLDVRVVINLTIFQLEEIRVNIP